MRELVKTAIAVAIITLLIGAAIFVSCLNIFGPINAEAESNVPPSPLKCTTYDMDGERVIKYYDTTTAHTWWVVREGNEWLVLDTDGSVNVG